MEHRYLQNTGVNLKNIGKNKTNKDYIEAIILEHYNQYYRLAFSYTHNEADALDIVQNGAYKAIRSADSLKEPEYAATWIYRIMLNECFSFAKKPRFVSYEKMLEENGIELSFAEDKYENTDLKKGIESLAPKDRAVIILKYFEDKTFEEIADILNENPNTIKSRLYRCLKKLRDYLSYEESQNVCNQ